MQQLLCWWSQCDTWLPSANTYGLLLLVYMPLWIWEPWWKTYSLICGPELLLWVRPNSVARDQWSFLLKYVVTPCVVPLAPVVPSTHHHGSMYDYPPPQLMTLRSGSVLLMELQLMILRYNSWNSMWNGLDRTETVKMDAILHEPCICYRSASDPKWPQKQSQSIYNSIFTLGELLSLNHSVWIRFVPDATESCTESTTILAVISLVHCIVVQH